MSIGKYCFQVVLLGDESRKEEIKKWLTEKWKKENKELLVWRTSDEVELRFPVAGVYFGNNECCDGEEMDKLLDQGVHVLPVVEDLKTVDQRIPRKLLPYNAVEVKQEKDYVKIWHFLLTEFRLLRKKKKVFISYCRKDASIFAHRLYDELNHRGYNTFLDSYSIEKGLDFQEELQEFLVDSDVMVFLHSPESAKSQWVQKELAIMNCAQIGVVEVQWPNVNTALPIVLSYPLPITNDMEIYCPYYISKTCCKVADAVDFWRIRSMQARFYNLRRPLLDYLGKKSVKHCFPSMLISGTDGKFKMYDPVVGMPSAVDYENTEQSMQSMTVCIKDLCSPSYIVYDSLCLKKNSVKHLQWLDKYLPVNSMDIRSIKMKSVLSQKRPLKRIFLSASIPPFSPKDSTYYQTVDVIAIRDAVRALAAHVLPYTHLVWGGHPAITPLIREVLDRMGVTCEEIKNHVTLYQSRFFKKEFPQDKCMENIHLTKWQADKEESLDLMRREMLDSKHNYVAGIFIGGKEGVEEECQIFQECHPNALLLPIASTGAAAQFLYRKELVKVPEGFNRERLLTDFDYMSLFQDLFSELIPGIKETEKL